MRLDWDVVYMRKEMISAEILDMVQDRLDEVGIEANDDRYEELVRLMYEDVENMVHISLSNYTARLNVDNADVL